MRQVYCYFFKDYNTRRIKDGDLPIFKIGATKRSADVRINEQDTTAIFEPIETAWVVDIPEDFMPNVDLVDNVFHDWLEKEKQIPKFRQDKDREWFEFHDAEEAKAYLMEFLTGVHAVDTYNMREAQQNAYDKMVSYFKNGGNNFLLAAKMRFGKNFTFLNFIKTMGYKNVLILTYKPGVFESLESDVDRHIFFHDDFEYISFKDKRDLKFTEGKTHIVTCSAQMAGYSYDEEADQITFNKKSVNKKNLKDLQKVKWDLIVTDECHYGTNTDNFKNIYESLNTPPILYISGTPFKTIGQYTDDAMFIYTYLDEQEEQEKMLKLNKIRLQDTLAKLVQYGIHMDTKLVKLYHKQVEVADYPTMTKVFQVNKDGNFTYPEIAKGLIDHVLNSGIRHPEMQEIRHMLMLFDHVSACKAVSEYINEHYAGKIYAINGAGNDGLNDTGKLQREITQANKSGLMSVTCSCGRFIEGTSIPEWNAVIMLHDGKSVERYFQAMFRGQTPYKDKTKHKDCFYVIDYNPDRLLSLNFNFINTLPQKTKSVTNAELGKAWLKATPIIITDPKSDQGFREVDYAEIERTYFTGGYAVTTFAVDCMFSKINDMLKNMSSDIRKYFRQYLESSKKQMTSKDTHVNEHGLTGGKNKGNILNTEAAEKDKKTPTEKTEKEYTATEFKADLKGKLENLPKYIICHKEVIDLHTLIESLNSDENKKDFSSEVGLDADVFIDMVVNYNVMNADGFEMVCNEFWTAYHELIENPDSNAEHRLAFRKQWGMTETETIPVSVAKDMINMLDFDNISKDTKIAQICITDTYVLELIHDKLKDKKLSDKSLYAIVTQPSKAKLLKTFMPELTIIVRDNFTKSDNSDMPKFDYIIQNPPYSGSLHLDFFNKGLDILKEDGKMVIIEPATWLINVRKTGKAKLYDQLKNRIKDHVKVIRIENYNKEFNTALYTPFAITVIDNSKIYNEIEYNCCGDYKKVSSLYDCNLIGQYDLIWSIFNKVLSYGDMMKHHVYNPGKTATDKNTWYCKYPTIIGGMGGVLCASAHPSHVRGGGYSFDTSFYKTNIGEYLTPYISTGWHYNHNSISQTLHVSYNSANKPTDKIAANLYGTKEELENWKHFIFNNKLPIFTNIVLVIDQHNNSSELLCWLTDKTYSDQEIYEKFNFTDEEIKLIESTIKKYERNSPWFKRYMCGPSEVSDEEVMNFFNS